jgi:hypothetical protein
MAMASRACSLLVRIAFEYRRGRSGLSNENKQSLFVRLDTAGPGGHYTRMVSSALRSLTCEYVWPSPDAEALRSLLLSDLPGFFPPARVNATCTTEGRISKGIDFNSLSDWLPSPGVNVDRFRASLSGDGERCSVWLDWNANDARLSLTAQSSMADAETQLDAIRELFETRLGLKPRSRNSTDLTFTTAALDFPFLDPFMALAEQITGPSARFRGTWKLPGGVGAETEVKADWQSIIRGAQRWSGEWQGRGHRLTVNWESQYTNVRFEIQSWDTEVLTELAERIKGLLGLKVPNNKPLKQGEMRRYFLAGEATFPWYEKALSLILPFSDDASLSPWGRIRRGGKEKSNRGFGDLAAWKSALETAMRAGDIEQSYLSCFARERTITFDLDHLRDLLSIDVQSTVPAEVEDMHLKLSTELNLARAPETAYRERQWGRTFDIRLPDRKAFANQLRMAIGTAFQQRRVLLTSGTLHLGDNDEEVKQYSVLEELLDDFVTVRDLSQVHIALAGPHGDFIGIHVEKKLTRLRLLAAMRLDLFQTFAATLKIGLKRMELSETYDTDPAAGVAPEKKSTWVVPLGTAALGLLGGLVGTKLYEARREPPEIIIDRPLAKDGVAEIKAHDTTVSWTYREPRLAAPPTMDGNHQAIVNVVRLSDNRPILQDERKTGSASLSGLEDGSYYIKIDAGESYKTLVVTVKTQATPPAPPAAEDSAPKNRRGKRPGE